MTVVSQLAFSETNFQTAAYAIADARGVAEDGRPTDGFLAQYLSDALVEDFAHLAIADAAALAVDLWTSAPAGDGARSVRVREATGADGRSLNLDVAEIVGRDAAFLVDSAIACCSAFGVEVRANPHPIVEIEGERRSFIQLHVPSLGEVRRAELETRLQETLVDVDAANADFQTMREAMKAAAARVRALPSSDPVVAEDIAESADFLDWVGSDHFTFLGVREYDYAHTGEEAFAPRVVDGSNLGILKDVDRHVLSRGAEPAQITPRILNFLEETQPIIVAKSNMLSRVHRRVYADYIGVKKYDEAGRVVGETRFVGLFTSEAYTRAVMDVPLIRRKAARVAAAHSNGPSRYSQRALNNVLETFPRDELLQISEADLMRIADGVVRLQHRPRTQIFIRRDRFDRYVSILMYTPRDAYNSQLRAKAHKLLADAYAGRQSAFYPNFSDGPLARVHYIIGLNPGHPEPDEDELELAVRQLAESWEDGLLRAAQRMGRDAPFDIDQTFTAAYREAFAPDEGLADLDAIAAMSEEDDIRVRVYGPEFSYDTVYCKIYRRDASLDLSDVVPVLENMGLRVRAETGYLLSLPLEDGRREVWVHDVVMDKPADGGALTAAFEGAFKAVWDGRTEDDGFNRLVVKLGVDWRRAALLRTLCRYRQQTGLDPSEAVQISALTQNDEITRALLDLFAVRFDPDVAGALDQRRAESEPLSASIETALEAVASLDADRVLRRLSTLIQAIQRTNFYQLGAAGEPPAHIAIKIASRELENLPAPKPFREIFVWSPEVEGVHLRFGPVARGGLRWSDRRDDFRTEILGLVKAQQVKNAVIVPVGSKGGFYPKQLPSGGSRDDIMAAGVSAYKTFISSLIEITDNMEEGAPKRPDRCVAWDGDDPYLVVAADKGTATFSDIANGISADHNFWLDDAFASGGSVGYDHKKMGITARGGWEAVKRHFRELGKDIQNEPFTVIGVGDMSGDVFGNGMLLSKQTKLIAAFNHMHIFLDPDPDPAASWEERKRLFETPRTSWADYNSELISQGGGVFARADKSIALSDEIRALTGLTDETISPDALLNALLKSPAELLWFGGIGTYIKSREEQNFEVGDKANDALRVNGEDLRVKVIGEGANLGVTQAGRIEFARIGGRVNTDAVDNSAGVDSSDHEVNIKILLAEAIRSGDLAPEARDELLASMTDDVAAHVLVNNYDQTGALTQLAHTAAADLDAHERFIETLEGEGKLDRVVEGLPSAEDFRTLRETGVGLTRPELSILMAYAKIDLFDALVDSAAPEDPAFAPLLQTYFPKALAEFDDARANHRLRREIIATRLANRLVNATGPIFPYQMRDAAAVPVECLVQAVEAARAVYGMNALFDRIDALDNQVSADAQILMRREASDALRRFAAAFSVDADRIGATSAQTLIDRYGPCVAELRPLTPQIVSSFVMARVDTRADTYKLAGAPSDLALDVASLGAIASIKEAIDVSQQSGWPLLQSAYMHAAIGEALGLDRVRAAARDLDVTEHWDRLAVERVADDLPALQAALAAEVIRYAANTGADPENLDRNGALIAVDSWMAPHAASAQRVIQPIKSFEHAQSWSLAKLVLAGDAVREFVTASTVKH